MKLRNRTELLQATLHKLAIRFRESIFGAWGRSKAQRRLKQPGRQGAHGLPAELIVSLTSYPARFGTLHLTLACLLDQTITPDRTILWIAHNDVARLPKPVRELEQRGLEVRTCDDLRSFKKLVPALESFPDAYIATADDDAYYPADWLERLVDAARSGAISCHRAHRMRLRSDGRLASYLEWAFNVRDARSRRPATNLVPTGIGGILYPPHCLDPRVTNRELFERLCPDGDDLWFYWCGRMAGTLTRRADGKLRKILWAESQNSSLWEQNKRGGNDRMIRALEEEFGPLP